MAASIVSTITTAFTSTAQAIGTGVVDLFKDLFCVVSEQGAVTGLSELGIFVLTMAGVGFAFGLSKFLVSLVRNRG